MVSHAQRPRRAVIVSASVGAGHDGAAAELARRFELAGFEVDRHDFLDLLPPTLGPITRRSYKVALRLVPGSWEWLLARIDHGHGLWSGASGLAGLARRRTRRATAAEPTVVVSTYPLASQVLGQLRESGRLSAPVITFLTDMSVHPLWVHPQVDLHLALHEVAAAQARAHGAGDIRIAGPAVRPIFAPVAPDDRAELRERFLLPQADRLALVVAGSWGVGEIEESVRDIAATGLATPVVACGRNRALASRIRRSGVGHAVGWTSDMPALINACDVVVQNAGGLTSLEALTCGVPVITYRCLVGHGRMNAEALDRSGWAPWVTEPADLPEALHRALYADARVTPFTAADPVETAIRVVAPDAEDAAVRLETALRAERPTVPAARSTLDAAVTDPAAPTDPARLTDPAAVTTDVMSRTRAPA